MDTELAQKTKSIMQGYQVENLKETADKLQQYWLTFEPNRGIELIKAEQRQQIGVVGTPIPVLKAIGNEIAKSARQDVDKFLPLTRLLWDRYGREGRVIALIAFGAMELVKPQQLVPLIKELCRGCSSWEDADRLSMDALEPIVRKFPDQWLDEMAVWQKDENKWVRRAAITVIARLPMKHPKLTGQCLQLAGQMLGDSDLDVKRAVSFAIRISAKIDPDLVVSFMKNEVTAHTSETTWVLCDVIKSLDRKLIGKFSVLLPLYRNWHESPLVSAKDHRSIESAIKTLQA